MLALRNESSLISCVSHFVVLTIITDVPECSLSLVSIHRVSCLLSSDSVVSLERVSVLLGFNFVFVSDYVCASVLFCVRPHLDLLGSH